MEPIARIRQLLNESKFVEAQKEAEFCLLTSDNSARSEFIEIYFETLLLQSRELPTLLVLEHVENICRIRPDRAQELLAALGTAAQQRHTRRILIQKILIAEIKGQNEELYQYISELQINTFSKRTPNVPEVVLSIAEKYFADDFVLRLQQTAILLMTLDLDKSEELINDLIFSCLERATPKRTNDKLLAVAEVLTSVEVSTRLEIYKSLCLFLAEGDLKKQDIKRVIEMIIYADDFRLQTLILALLDKVLPGEVSREYAEVIKQNEKYDFVYFDKYFRHLKKYFHTPEPEQEKVIEKSFTFGEMSIPAASVEVSISNPRCYDKSEEEYLIGRLLKHQSFSDNELLDLAVGFLQAEFPWAAINAVDIVIGGTTENTQWLKASYLKLTALLLLNDCRSVVDLAMDSLKKSQSKDDVLSFMYCLAEAQYRLKEYKSAKATFQRILSLDENYRLAKEKLEMINAI